MCGFENILKRGQCDGNLCNDLCGDVYEDVCLLKRFSFAFESSFESVVLCGFEIRQAFCFTSLIQVTKRLSTPKFLKRLLLCFNPFNKFVPPLYLVDNLVLGCERDRRGSSFGP